MSETQFWIQIGIQIAAVLATLLLGVIAIWGDNIKAKFLGPKLQLSLFNPGGERINLTDGTNTRYYHLRVTNIRRSAQAHKVRVVVTKIVRPADGYLSQKEGALKYNIGPLKVTVQKRNEQITAFEIKNPTDKDVQEKIILSSDSQIKNVIFNKGNNFFSVVDGGIGNNYIVYNVELPPNGFASGSTVSAGIVIPSAISDEDNLIDKK